MPGIRLCWWGKNFDNGYNIWNYDCLGLPFLPLSCGNIENSNALFSLPDSVSLSSFWQSHQVHDPHLGHNGRLKYRPAVILSDSSFSLSRWPWQPVTVRSRTQHKVAHRLILWVFVTCSQKMPLSLFKEMYRVGSTGAAWEGTREDVKCWFMILAKVRPIRDR